MKIHQVAIQLFTLREHCQNVADLTRTAKKVREIGYQSVQVSGVGPVPEAELLAIMDGEGLRICATHEPSPVILDETDKVIDRLKKLGCSFTAYPAPVGIDLTDQVQLDNLVRKLDVAGAKLRAAGLTLGYHNHAWEFVKFRGRPVLEYIFQHTDAENLTSELDTYWCHFGGCDVIDWCERLKGRLPFLHLKDFRYDREQNKPVYCEIGAGNLDFKRIIATAEQSGCRGFIVEQDHTPGDPFDSIRQSFDYIKANLVA